MMNDIRHRRRRLRRILGEAYRQGQQDGPHPDSAWRHQVMARLARSSQPVFRIDRWGLMERLVWRFVPAAGALTLLLAVWFSQVAPDPAGEWSRLLSVDVAVPGFYAYYQSEPQNE
jgi:hypothetical protein